MRIPLHSTFESIPRRVLGWLRILFLKLRRRERLPQPAVEPLPLPELAPIVPPTEPAVPVTQEPASPLVVPLVRTRRRRKDKWATPIGLDLLQPIPRPPKLDAAPKPAKPKRPVVHVEADESVEEFGQFHFRGAILDDLERYFAYLGRMKRSDPDSYHLHRQIGIQIVPEQAMKTFNRMREEGALTVPGAWFRKEMPSFGAVSYGFGEGSDHLDTVKIVDDLPEDYKTKPLPEALHEAVIMVSKGKGKEGIFWVPRFLYFAKYETPKGKPPDIEMPPPGYIVYRMTVYWDRLYGTTNYRAKRKHGTPQDYAVGVHKDGDLVLLKIRMTEQVKIIHRDGYARLRGGKDISTHPHDFWTIPLHYMPWTEERSVPPLEYLKRLFVEATTLYESAAMGSLIRVEIQKRDMVAVFGVEVRRTAYFFKDRDVTVTSNGRRQRIFHAVRLHHRETKKGLTTVKMHFRGLKQFTWAGYKVKITVPVRDHLALPEFNIGALDFPHEREVTGMMNMNVLGSKLKNAVHQRVGAK